MPPVAVPAGHRRSRTRYEFDCASLGAAPAAEVLPAALWAPVPCHLGPVQQPAAAAVHFGCSSAGCPLTAVWRWF